jgi:hypothetical protein
LPAPLYLNPGNYSVTGSGGGDVPTIQASLALPTAIQWNNQDSISPISRNRDLEITWIGGAPGDYVAISGLSLRDNPAAGANFSCTAPVSAGRFTVPAFVLSAMPPGRGAIEVSHGPGMNTRRFSAPGLDVGVFVYQFRYIRTAIYE